MSITLITPPAIEPLTVQEAKEHLRVSGSSEDAYIAGRIKDARSFVEDFTGRALLTQAWEANFDGFPCSRVLRLEVAPLIQVTSFKYKGYDLNAVDVPAQNYTVQTKKTPGQITLKYGYVWPITAYEPEVVTVQYLAGYGTSPKSVPGALIDGLLFMLGHLYANREAVITGVRAQAINVPQTLETMLNPYVVNT